LEEKEQEKEPRKETREGGGATLWKRLGEGGRELNVRKQGMWWQQKTVNPEKEDSIEPGERKLGTIGFHQSEKST